MNASRWSTAVVAVFVLALEASGLLAGEPASGAPAKPENLARKAQASASTAHSDQYQAPFACDGQVPAPGSADDVGKAWVARGNDHPEGVVFTLQWPEPVTIAEVVYYGRTAFAASENWKDFEIRLDDAPAVALALPARGAARIPGRRRSRSTRRGRPTRPWGHSFPPTSC